MSFGVVLGGHTFFMGVVLCRFDAKSVSAGILGSGHTGRQVFWLFRLGKGHA